MYKNLKIISCVMVTSVLLSGCTQVNNVVIPNANNKPIMQIIEPSQANANGFNVVTKAFTLHGLSQREDDTDGVLPIVLVSSPEEKLKCVFFAEAKVNIPTERFRVRLNGARCTDDNNNTFEVKDLNGYVVGADGIYGIKGQIVANMGATIKRTFDNEKHKFTNTVSDTNITTIVTSYQEPAPLMLETNTHTSVSVITTKGVLFKKIGLGQSNER